MWPFRITFTVGCRTSSLDPLSWELLGVEGQERHDWQDNQCGAKETLVNLKLLQGAEFPLLLPLLLQCGPAFVASVGVQGS